MAVGVLEIDAAAAVVPADFAGAISVGIGPVLESSLADRAKIWSNSSSLIRKA